MIGRNIYARKTIHLDTPDDIHNFYIKRGGITSGEKII